MGQGGIILYSIKLTTFIMDRRKYTGPKMRRPEPPTRGHGCFYWGQHDLAQVREKNMTHKCSVCI